MFTLPSIRLEYADVDCFVARTLKRDCNVQVNFIYYISIYTSYC